MDENRTQLVLMLGIAAVTGAVFWIAEGAASGLLTGGIVALFALVVGLGRRRSDTLEVMSGLGDERTRSLYTRAVALAGTLMSVVLPGWWLVTVATGEANETLSLVCALFGVAFIGSVIVLARRG
jgi:hypothetical protein